MSEDNNKKIGVNSHLNNDIGKADRKAVRVKLRKIESIFSIFNRFYNQRQKFIEHKAEKDTVQLDDILTTFGIHNNKENCNELTRIFSDMKNNKSKTIKKVRLMLFECGRINALDEPIFTNSVTENGDREYKICYLDSDYIRVDNRFHKRTMTNLKSRSKIDSILIERGRLAIVNENNKELISCITMSK